MTTTKQIYGFDNFCHIDMIRNSRYSRSFTQKTLPEVVFQRKMEIHFNRIS